MPVAVLCDNSRDAEMIPSDLSDFCRYGGLYRHVNLVYVPAISLAQVHITPKLAADGTASVRVQARALQSDCVERRSFNSRSKSAIRRETLFNR